MIALVDSETGLVGRSVWTDERGDQVFSELQGQGTAAQNRIVGTEELLDKDGDLVPDALEEGLHVDPKNRNTYGIGPNGDDEEFLCWIAEAAWKIGSADMEDWAKPGKQWK